MNKTIRILETDFITEVNEHIAELKEHEVNFVSSNVPVSGELPNCIECYNKIEIGDKFCKYCGYEQDKKFGNLR